MIRRAVTLLELIIALMVVALLVSLSLAAIHGVRQSAMRVACQANLRGLHSALVEYSIDHRGLLPFADSVYSAPDAWTEPLDSLSPYIDASLPSVDWSARIVITGPPWLCPGDREWGPEYGLSYGYVPFQFMQIIGAEATTRIYDDDPSKPVFIDYLPWHGGRNELRHDGAVSNARN